MRCVSVLDLTEIKLIRLRIRSIPLVENMLGMPARRPLLIIVLPARGLTVTLVLLSSPPLGTRFMERTSALYPHLPLALGTG